MPEKPTYQELEQRIKELDEGSVKRKQAEESLRESKERYRSLFKNNHSIMLLIDPENADIVDANPAAISYYGWSYKELTGKKITDINILTKEKVFQEMERAKKEKRQRFFFRHRLSNGEIRDVEVYSGPITIHGRKLLYSIIHDITDRKQAEAALRESEERFRKLFEKVPAPIQGYGPDGTIHYWNKASENIYGYKKDEAIGKNLIELIIPPEMRDFVHDAIKQGAETGEMPPPGEHLLMRQDGSRVPVFSNHTVLKLGKKEPELYCLDVDMTVQKKLQERLQQVQKMEAISTLSGGIAHQFNNALSGITGNIDLLEMDFSDNETVVNYTRAMKDYARLMIQLTARLLAYARGGKFQAKTVSFSDFVRETLPLIKHALGSAIDVDTDLPLGILNVKADLTQMQMVLSAVLTNASEAMEGKGRIRVACRDTIITDETVGDFPGLTSGNYVHLTIVDDGKGMDDETRTRIFEPFFTTKFQGRGLGMAATYGIVKNHDGWISVDSVLGQGTTVNIYLPIVEVPVKKQGKPKPKAEWIKGTGTILVIEDEEPVMKTSRAILERLGYRVLEARTGQEAIDVVKTFDGQIDLAMLDMLLPDMSGKDIYPLIMETRPDLKVIVFSGYSIDDAALEILNAGAEDFIQKPFMISDLSEKLKKILGGGQ